MFETELAQQGRHLVLHGLLREPQPLGDLPVRETLRDERENLPFPQAEGAESRVLVVSAARLPRRPRWCVGVG